MEPYHISLGALLTLIPASVYFLSSTYITTVQGAIGIFNIIFIVSFLALMFGAMESTEHNGNISH